MSKKILFAVDGSSKCFQALESIAHLVSHQHCFHFTLFHCTPQVSHLYPGELWEAESAVALAARTQTEHAQEIFAEAKRILVENGIAEDRIVSTLKTNSTDPGSDILDEAKNHGFETVIVGRRGRSPAQSLLLGSVSSRVAEYADNRTVWVVDAPVRETRKVLIAVEGHPECRALTYYAAEWLAPVANLSYTIFHLLPPLPPTFWDDGHILDEKERSRRQLELRNWKKQWNDKVEKFMDEGRHALEANGVAPDAIQTRVERVREGIARDILKEIERHHYQLVVIGKRSFKKRKPFLMGGHANKILHHAKETTLCLVDSR